VFGMSDTIVMIVGTTGVCDRVAASKAVVAHQILDAVINHRAMAN
jgi:hypothetical protein